MEKNSSIVIKFYEIIMWILLVLGFIVSCESSFLSQEDITTFTRFMLLLGNYIPYLVMAFACFITKNFFECLSSILNYLYEIKILIQGQTDFIRKQNTTTTTIIQQNNPQKKQNTSEPKQCQGSPDNNIMSQREFEAKERQLLGKIK